MKVLLVEDEQKIANFVCAGRAARGMTVTHCSDGNSGFARGSQKPFDTIVLDIMLPAVMDRR